MQKRRIAVAVLVIIVMFAIIAAYMFFSYSRIKPDDGKICNGIKVDSVDLSGMTKEQAVKAVGSHTDRLKCRIVEIDVNGQIVTTTVGDVGYSFTAENAIDEALKVGKGGNAFENYSEIKKAAQGEVSYPIKTVFNEDVLKKFVKKNCKKYCTAAKNASVKMQNGEFVYTKARQGLTIDVDGTAQVIKKAVEKAGEQDNISVTAHIVVAEPEVTEETAAKCKDKLGSFSTTFNAANINRSKNLANAARLINGSVIYPGDTFSVHDTISPLNEDNGYYAAPSYNNGKVEDSLGGGVCQVSTTLYNAVLRAELDIAERSPHSMVVSYVDPSMDAAIAGDYKDFKFKNNTGVPIYIQGGTYSGTIYFNVYGEETRSSEREVTFKSEVTQEIKPGADKVTYDKTKPESYVKVEQEAHTGYKAILWKIVNENGKETKTQINSSTYSAAPRYVTKGSKKEEAPTATVKPTEKPIATKKPTTSKDNNKKNPQNNNSGSQSNQGNTTNTKPVATAAPEADDAGVTE